MVENVTLFQTPLSLDFRFFPLSPHDSQTHQSFSSGHYEEHITHASLSKTSPTVRYLIYFLFSSQFISPTYSQFWRQISYFHLHFKLYSASACVYLTLTYTHCVPRIFHIISFFIKIKDIFKSATRMHFFHNRRLHSFEPILDHASYNIYLFISFYLAI